MSDLFVSYSRDDYEFVKKFHKAIQSTEREAWIDSSDIPKGEKFWDQITKEIDKADTFVFIMSPSSVERASSNEGYEWCRREIEYAAKQNKRIIPIVSQEAVILERNILDKNILAHKILSERNWIYFGDPSDFDNSLQVLIQAIDFDLSNIKKHAELTLHRYRRTNKSYTRRSGRWGEADVDADPSE